MSTRQFQARARALALAAGTLLSLHGFALGQAQKVELKPQVEGGVDPVDVSTPTFTPAESTETTFWNAEFNQWPGSRNLRIHFGEVKLPSGFTGKLVLSDRSGRVVETYQGDMLATIQDGWSKVVPGDYALLSLIAEKPPVGFRAVVDQVAFTSNDGVALSIIGADEMQEVDEYSRDPAVIAVSRSVAKLSFIKDGRQFTCTGFLYGKTKNRMMTNEHCVNSAQLCRSTVATFHYQLENGTLDRGTQYRCKSFVVANSDLDFAEIELEGNPADMWGTLQLSSEDVREKQELMIIQHPGGRPKMISRVNCVATKPVADGISQKSDIAHTCDTEHGSSGSPLLNLAGSVVGLHHFGVADGPYWNENRAVRMAEILKKLKD
ncbi:trypsin-like serine peptidase [Rhizobium binxianense]|uniref:trypsin-like serine peptidase n=1 Tax=Rhizobium binxianense TaxID=3024242 RepID=UPI00235FBE9E|nr:serine protease [Rhizobium sp. MJ37]MDC9835134.1 serine protease [Rhizobium sp. MJ37]